MLTNDVVSLGAELDTVLVQLEKQKADQQQLQSHANLIDSLRSQADALTVRSETLLAVATFEHQRCHHNIFVSYRHMFGILHSE